MQAIRYEVDPERVEREKQLLELRLFAAENAEKLKAAMAARAAKAAESGGRVIARVPIRAAAKRYRPGRKGKVRAASPASPAEGGEEE